MKQYKWKSRGIGELARMYDGAPKAKTRVPNLMRKLLKKR